MAMVILTLIYNRDTFHYVGLSECLIVSDWGLIMVLCVKKDKRFRNTFFSLFKKHATNFWTAILIKIKNTK